MDKKILKNLIQTAGFSIVSETRMKNDYGDTFKISNGSIINVFDTGKCTVQGKNTEEIKCIIENNECTKGSVNNKVFVVYGHDQTARTQLEAMIRRWGLEPLIIDQLETSGYTVIEKLEEYMPQASFGIVLATPDDRGGSKESTIQKYRVRQNVVLELGMLLARLGRAKVAILLKNTEDMEKPSDINGLIYIPFKEDVQETSICLAKELNKNGYIIDISKL